MITPSLKDLHDALMTNSADVVENYLLQGAVNPNVNHASLLPAWNTVVDSYGNVAPNCTVATSGNNATISALHLAVLNCFYNHSHPVYLQLNQESLKILQALLDCGADTTLTMSGIYVGLPSSTNGNSPSLTVAENGITPLQLAIFLKKNMQTTSSPMQADQQQHNKGRELMMNQVTNILLQASKATSSPDSYKHEPFKIRATSVPNSVLDSWKSMLVNSQFWDVTFACSDGKTFSAHKCILSAASGYFANYFSGPWAQHHPDGVWKTTNSSEVMWAVLQFIYTGVLPEATVSAHAHELLCVAHEYQLPQLFLICQANCIRSISCENVKTLLQLAHLLDSPELERACFDFVRRHAAETLTQPDIVALATQDPTLWKKLTLAVSSFAPNGNGKQQ